MLSSYLDFWVYHSLYRVEQDFLLKNWSISSKIICFSFLNQKFVLKLHGNHLINVRNIKNKSFCLFKKKIASKRVIVTYGTNFWQFQNSNLRHIFSLRSHVGSLQNIKLEPIRKRKNEVSMENLKMKKKFFWPLFMSIFSLLYQR